MGSSGGWGTSAFRLLIGICCLTLAGQAVRTAAVAAYAEEAPSRALRFWPGHPLALSQQALSEIGAAAASGRAPSPLSVQAMRSAASRSPMLVEPLLVAGAAALAAGDYDRGEKLLGEASRRDPRNVAARVMLAETYIRGGKVRAGLEQIVALGRRYPSAYVQFAPAIAAYAKQPAGAAPVAAALKGSPELRDAVLGELAREPRQAELVLALAGPEGSGGPPPAWQARLLQSLVEAGDISGAHRVWQRFSGSADRRGGLFNGGFDRLTALPPFNWRYANGGEGVAEPKGKGRLQLVYYGRTDTPLLAQLVRVAPGRWRLRYHLTGSPVDAAAFAWTVRCAGDGRVVARTPLQPGLAAINFTIPSSCPDQWVEVRGVPGEFARTVHAELSGLSLNREVS